MKAERISVYLPDARGVEISRYGYGNLKIGLGVFTYSRPPGLPGHTALGEDRVERPARGTCPGATHECLKICYAARPMEENGAVAQVWRNNEGVDVPPIPAQARMLRIHVSGDFNSIGYIEQWISRLTERPDVVTWAYTKSWRVPELLPALERLRGLPNVQLFASVDPSMTDLPPDGWRRAWIWRDAPSADGPMEARLSWDMTEQTAPDGVYTKVSTDNQTAMDGTPSYICPEETGRKRNCVECGYCFAGRKNDVTFLEH